MVLRSLGSEEVMNMDKEKEAGEQKPTKLADGEWPKSDLPQESATPGDEVNDMVKKAEKVN